MSTDESVVDRYVLRSANQVLQHIDNGRLAAELTEEIRSMVGDLTNAKMEGAKTPKGKVVVTLDFALEEGEIELRHDLKVTKPKLPRRRTLLWATPDNNLCARDPRQEQLPLRDVATMPNVRDA